MRDRRRPRRSPDGFPSEATRSMTCTAGGIGSGQRGSRLARDKSARAAKRVFDTVRETLGALKQPLAGCHCRSARRRGPRRAARFRDSPGQPRRSRKRGPFPAEEIASFRSRQSQDFLSRAASATTGLRVVAAVASEQRDRRLRIGIPRSRVQSGNRVAFHAGRAGCGRRRRVLLWS